MSPGLRDRPLDEHVARVDVVSRLLEHDDVAAAHVAVREKPRERRQPRREGELVDEQVVADEDRLLHRAGRDLVGLDDEGPDEEDEDAGDEQRLVPFARRGVRGRSCRRRSLRRASVVCHSTFRTARKASCGMSTRPTLFIRFFPSFCFSSSFRLARDVAAVALGEHVLSDRRDLSPGR